MDGFFLFCGYCFMYSINEVSLLDITNSKKESVPDTQQ